MTGFLDVGFEAVEGECFGRFCGLDGFHGSAAIDNFGLGVAGDIRLRGVGVWHAGMVLGGG